MTFNVVCRMVPQVKIFGMEPDDPRLNGIAGVWVNPTGETYHRRTCSGVRPGAQVHRVNDVRRTHRPCKKCNPPVVPAGV